jgi:hypothetical protein
MFPLIDTLAECAFLLDGRSTLESNVSICSALWLDRESSRTVPQDVLDIFGEVGIEDRAVPVSSS